MAIQLRSSRNHPEASPADIIQDTIATGLAVCDVVNKGKYFTDLNRRRAIGNIIRDCNGSLNMHANGRGRGCLYREQCLSEIRGESKEICDHAVPVTELVRRYEQGGVPLVELIFSPVVRLSKESDRLLQAKGFSKKGFSSGYPLARYSRVNLRILTHLGEEVNPATWTDRQHWDLVRSTAELREVLEALNLY